MRQTLAAFTAVSAVLGAQYLGARGAPHPDRPKTLRWYRSLEKPSFSPPPPVYGIVWTAIDSLVGYAGYRLLQAPCSQARERALIAWSLSVAGIGGYPWVMFREKSVVGALGVAVGLIVTTTGAMWSAAKVDRRAALAMLPMLAWLLFATLLQEEIVRLNPRER
ncbi:TspO/MBR family protein [Tanticharoenia sakaeratensis]|jgi:translocator protein|uniref:Tryptophan-rich sensory protein n=1 Tax=Tanticharoenia sakaeratensis NBRC 103193 TaxID=1231623 RepID=A0A0D6MQG6_9PROT|nr:TspO/MBR family protein [Tanticharoenia sakaeratensis]GAN55513.1 hypothetical protein Tasa_048_138 [Tanticharoenia sakaeratensis NBRC 103193]GBQ21865.1 hypothetical protein AA103193_1874 [Tanticharoenia sakaeratensis NBRC 103193]